MSGLSAVVVNYNGGALLARCLASIRAACTVETRIIVVDNGSSDGSAQGLDGVELIELGENRGFAAAANAGIRAGDSEWVALVNPDATLAPEALRAFAQCEERLAATVGMIAPQIRYASDGLTINSAGIIVDERGVAFERLVGRPCAEAEEAGAVFAVSGGGAFLRRRMLDEIGLFDERFFLYYEDVDLCWRAQARGWRARYEPAIVIYHEHSASSRQGSSVKLYNVGRNRVRTLAKNAPAPLLRRNALRILAFEALYVLYSALVLRTLAPARGRLAGFRDWRAFRPSAPPPPAPLAPPSTLRAALERRRAAARNTWSARS